MNERGLIERKEDGSWLIHSVEFVGLTYDDIYTMIKAVEKNKKDVEKYDD